MKPLYATVITNMRNYWGNPNDLIGVYTSRQAAEKSLKIWLDDFDYADQLKTYLQILKADYKSLSSENEKVRYQWADNVNNSIHIAPIMPDSYIDRSELDQSEDAVDLLDLIEH